MVKRILFCLAVATLLMGVTSISTVRVAAPGPTPLVGCGPLAPGAYIVAAPILTAATCFTITGSGVLLNLGGMTVTCAGAGYLGSCQGTGAIGIDTAGFSDITIKGPGTITGFAIGVLVGPGGSSVNVQSLVVTGPAAPPGSVPKPSAVANLRPASTGIEVMGTICPVPADTIVNIKGNVVSNHREGIELSDAQCVNVHRNVVHDNNADPVECHGIVLHDSSFNNIGHNDIFSNGENLGTDGGLTLKSSSSNTIQSNKVFGNFGSGISLRFGSAANEVTDNDVSGHVLFGGDLSELFQPFGLNSYADSNCYSTTNIVPAPTISAVCPRPGAGA